MDSVGNELPQGQQIFTSKLIDFSNSSSGLWLLISKPLCPLVAKSANSIFRIFLEHDSGYCITKTMRWWKTRLPSNWRSRGWRLRRNKGYESYKNDILFTKQFSKNELSRQLRTKWHIQDTHQGIYTQH